MDEKQALQELAKEALNEARTNTADSAVAVTQAVRLLCKKKPGLSDSEAFLHIWSLLPR